MKSKKISIIKDNIKNILSLLGTLSLFIILKIVDNFLGNDVPIIEYMYTCAIIIVSVCIVYICLVYTIIKLLTKLDHKFTSSEFPIAEKCKYDDRICCANLAINALKGDFSFSLDKTIAETYNLVSEEELMKYEASFNDGEIWIFSYDLTTEVLQDAASKTFIKNLKKGVTYREFYIEDTDEITGNASTNRKKMEEWYREADSKNGVKNLYFYPYNNPDSMLNYIFALFGIALYIKSSAQIDAYFSLRSSDSRIKQPIYVKMPYCMTNRYYRIFKSIIDNNI